MSDSFDRFLERIGIPCPLRPDGASQAAPGEIDAAVERLQADKDMQEALDLFVLTRDRLLEAAVLLAKGQPHWLEKIDALRNSSPPAKP